MGDGVSCWVKVSSRGPWDQTKKGHAKMGYMIGLCDKDCMQANTRAKNGASREVTIAGFSMNWSRVAEKTCL